MTRTLRQAILATVIVSAGCASSPGPEAGGSDAHDHSPAMAATAGPGFTAADVHFMQGMIGHHAQAITMAELAPTHGAGDQILKLAEKIDISQRDEIAFMQDWLTDRKQPVPDSMQMHTMHMPGMLTPAQLARLAAARGRSFDRLFLSLMIQHHEGALEMVDALFASPGAGQDPDIFRFATDVMTDQRDEIGVMNHMLDILDTTRGSEPR